MKVFNKLYVILAEENRFPEALAALWACVTGPFLATLQIASRSKMTLRAGRLVNRAWVMSKLHNACRAGLVEMRFTYPSCWRTGSEHGEGGSTVTAET